MEIPKRENTFEYSAIVQSLKKKSVWWERDFEYHIDKLRVLLQSKDKPKATERRREFFSKVLCGIECQSQVQKVQVFSVFFLNVLKIT